LWNNPPPNLKGKNMAHFYGTLNGSRGEATRCGTKNSGMRAVAASWSGAVESELFVDPATGEDFVEVSLIPWHGVGVREIIYRGPVGRYNNEFDKIPV
jgi:hypothetical protein